MSILSLKYEKNYERLYKDVIIELIGTFLATIGISLFVWMVLWSINNNVTGLILVSINIFILGTIFLINWNVAKYRGNTSILSSGFLVVTMFDFLYVYNYNYLTSDIHNDIMPLDFWVIARLLEFVVLLTYFTRPNLIKKWENTISLAFGILVLSLIYIINENIIRIDNFYNVYKITNVKLILNFLSIALIIFMCIKVRGSIKNNTFMDYKYSYLSIFFIVLSIVLLNLLGALSSFWGVFTTILRTLGYFYLYKESFINLNKNSNFMSNGQSSNGTSRVESYIHLNKNKVKKGLDLRNWSLNVEDLLNAVSVPTMILDYRGNIVVCSKSYADLLDMKYEDIIDRNANDLVRSINLASKNISNLFDLSNYKNKCEECYIETPKGNKRYVNINLSSIDDSYNDKIGLVCVMQDITTIKEEQKKLINQEKLALMGQMGATIVHETRNFLTTIKGNSQLIELYCNNDKIKGYAQKINCDTNEVNRIITDFLNLSKPRETELEEISFSDLVLSMKNTIETSSLMSNSQLVLDINYDERYILCDETQIKQVILNICKNAVESMEKVVNPTLRIATGLDEDNKEAFISISDNGTGIDKENIKKIGTPFFTTKKTGTGLGLNACFQIIKDHGGRIEIQSELGKGTTFKIIIPYIDEDEEEDYI